MNEQHRLLTKQIAKASASSGTLDISYLLRLVSKIYEENDFERRRTDRATALMAEELAEANDSLEQMITELEVQNLRFMTALENMPQGLCLFDAESRLLVCNRRFIELYSLPTEMAVPGTLLADLLRSSPAFGDAADEQTRRQIVNHVNITENAKHRMFHHALTGGRLITIIHEPMANGGFVETFADTTEQRLAEARIAHLAHHDPLTDLPNRTLLRQRLEEALCRVDRGERCSVLCLDLDQFKSVNDTLGHPVGDKLLKAVTERLHRTLRQSDTVARLGGDEFAIIQVSLDQPTDSTALASRLLDALGIPFEIDGHSVAIGVSIGIAVAPDDGADPDQLLKNADIALYRAKSDGRGRYRFFEPGMDAAMQARRLLELDLRNALALHEFELYYQPLVEIRTREITGFEALLRWKSPKRGMVSPAEFIPLAEETGLIIPLGEWVLHQATLEAASWAKKVKVAVNVSAVQFKKKGLVDIVGAALKASGLDPARLELEITESVMVDNWESAVHTLHQLKALGTHIAMDDFGTGYSSLSYLRSFPFDKIKIDQSFVRDLGNTTDSTAIIRAVTGLCGSLGITSTAEGVETAAQLALLGMESCGQAQGYLFSKPRPAHEIQALLEKGYDNNPLFGPVASAA